MLNTYPLEELASGSPNFITTLFTGSLMCLWTFCILHKQISNADHFENNTTNFCLHIFEEKFKGTVAPV
jgi:hypothetical protein